MVLIASLNEILQKKRKNKISENVEKCFINNNVEEKNEEYNAETNAEIQNIEDTKDAENLNILGYLTIPDILLEEAPIMEGTDLETLSKAIGHFESTSLFYGNVGLASHNSGGQGDYFKNLKDISIGSFIYYKTENGIEKYIVTFKQIISENDFTLLKENTNNRITLITCTKEGKSKRLCVQALEV